MMYRPLISTIRRTTLFVRGTAGAVIIAMLAMLSLPLSVAANTTTPPAPVEQSVEAQFSAKVLALQYLLEDTENRLNAGLDISAEQAEIDTLRAELEALDVTVMQHFAGIEADLQARGLPAVILDRHAAAVATYQQERDTLLANLDAFDQAPDATTRKARVKAARDHLKSKKHKRSQQPFDPDNLPNKSLKADPNNTPKLTVDEFIQAGLISNPTAMLAALGDFTFDQLPGASDPAYLAATTEVTLSPAIEAKAAELNHDAVTIFHWVRDKVAWIPSWGANQTAEHTLGSRKGNAIDISGLLIALLRASGIPARYVHGTIDVGAEKFRVWAGNFSDTGAASTFASAGGIPLADVISGGQISKVRLEHVWVEAALDYNPSRGAVNLDADNWVALDASFKLVTGQTFPDIVAVSGVLAEDIFTDYINSGIVNGSEGWVQGFDSQIIQQGYAVDSAAAGTIAAQVNTFLNDNLDSSGIIGLAQLVSGQFPADPLLPVVTSSIPNTVKTVGARYGQLPPALQGKIRFAFQKDILGELVNAVEFPLSAINGKQVELSFTFASEADHDAYAAYLPDGPITSPGELPSSIPSYLIDVVPELRVNGTVVQRGAVSSLGVDREFSWSIEIPGVYGVQNNSRTVPAGSHLGFGLVSGSVNSRNLKPVSTWLDSADQVLDTGTVDDIVAYAPNFFTAVLGNIYFAGLYEYFDSQLILGELMATGSGLGNFSMVAGAATFGYVPVVDYFFGVPRSISLGTIEVDAPSLLVNIAASDGNLQTRNHLALQIGIYGSSLEGRVASNWLSSDDQVEGHSAANAILEAMRQGQRIYHLTEANRSVLGQLNIPSSAADDITAALDDGLEVITHTDPVQFTGDTTGLTALGYIIQDPLTGSGAYLIDNGTNGGVKKAADEMIQTCAYVNRPEFVFNDNDWERFVIARKCAEYGRYLKNASRITELGTIKTKIDAAKKFHEVYAKVPLVIADCMTEGLPLILSEMLVLIRTAAAMLAVQAADLRVLVNADTLLKMANYLKNFVEDIHNFCIGEDFSFFD